MMYDSAGEISSTSACRKVPRPEQALEFRYTKTGRSVVTEKGTTSLPSPTSDPSASLLKRLWGRANLFKHALPREPSGTLFYSVVWVTTRKTMGMNLHGRLKGKYAIYTEMMNEDHQSILREY